MFDNPPKCWLHRQANFYAANWDKDTKVAQDGDVFAFYLPGKDANSKPVLGGGEFVLSFANRPEVQAFQTPGSDDPSRLTDALELFGRKVLPRIRDI